MGDGLKHWRFQGNRFFEGPSNKGDRKLSCKTCFSSSVLVVHVFFPGFPIEMITNDVPCNQACMMLLWLVTTHKYSTIINHPPFHKFNWKNFLVEKNCIKPTDAEPVKKVSNKIVPKKRKHMASTSIVCRMWDTVPHSPPSKLGSSLI
jgi:hypothetical protein